MLTNFDAGAAADQKLSADALTADRSNDIAGFLLPPREDMHAHFSSLVGSTVTSASFDKGDHFQLMPVADKETTEKPVPPELASILSDAAAHNGFSPASKRALEEAFKKLHVQDGNKGDVLNALEPLTRAVKTLRAPGADALLIGGIVGKDGTEKYFAALVKNLAEQEKFGNDIEAIDKADAEHTTAPSLPPNEMEMGRRELPELYKPLLDAATKDYNDTTPLDQTGEWTDAARNAARELFKQLSSRDGATNQSIMEGLFKMDERFNEIPAARSIALLWAKKGDETLYGMGFTNSDDQVRPLIHQFASGARPKNTTPIGIFTEQKPGQGI
jgi:hypothetical protein